MTTEIVIFLSALLISISIIVGSRYISLAIRPLDSKDKVSRDLLGRIKKAQIVRKKDDVDSLLEE